MHDQVKAAQRRKGKSGNDGARHQDQRKTEMKQSWSEQASKIHAVTQIKETMQSSPSWLTHLLRMCAGDLFIEEREIQASRIWHSTDSGAKRQ